MTSTLMIALNVVLDLGILGLLAWVMSRTGHLTPHRSELDVAVVTAERPQRHPRTHTRARRPTTVPASD